MKVIVIQNAVKHVPYSVDVARQIIIELPDGVTLQDIPADRLEEIYEEGFCGVDWEELDFNDGDDTYFEDLETGFGIADEDDEPDIRLDRNFDVIDGEQE